MLLKIIKKAHQKMIFSLSGILSIITLLAPIAFVVIGIVNVINQTDESDYYGIMWIILGAVSFLFSINRFKEFLALFKYLFKPESYDLIVNMKNDGIEIDKYDEELTNEDIINKLNKNNPIIITKNFIIGFTAYSFFILLKDDIVWCYEYNGNGIVFMDKHKSYGFTFFPQVDRNDEVIAELEKQIPYIYFGIDFDYQTIMHDDFENTLILIENEKEKFKENPETYLEEKKKAEQEKIDEETKRLEEEKNAELKKLEEQAGEEIGEESKED